MSEIIVRLYGNGTSDDSEAVQAFVDDRIVSFSDGRPPERDENGNIKMTPGEYIARQNSE